MWAPLGYVSCRECSILTAGFWDLTIFCTLVSILTTFFVSIFVDCFLLDRFGSDYFGFADGQGIKQHTNKVKIAVLSIAKIP